MGGRCGSRQDEGHLIAEKCFCIPADSRCDRKALGTKRNLRGTASVNLHTRTTDLEIALAEVPALDVHTHLVGGRLAARGLDDILLYHMIVSELYAAGCPSGSRLTQYPGSPSQEEAARRIEEALPYFEKTRNTSLSWLLRVVLRDLYGWNDPITKANWRRLDSMIRERADDRAWQRSVLCRANVRRCGTELARRGEGLDDDLLQYALEWAFFARCQRGEFDTALYELERCWGRTPEGPAPIGRGPRLPTERRIRTLDDVHGAVAHYVENIPEDRVISTAAHISTDIDFRSITDHEMAEALRRRVEAREKERGIYASYVQDAFLSAFESKASRVVYQFSLGAEPLPCETGSRLTQRTIAQVGEMIARHPKVRFQCFLSSRHANQALCTLARELPNLSLAGYWWHNFFPDVMRQVMAERLEMLPLNKQVGFFSDAYCVEWVYGKAFLIRKLMAQVLASRIDLGQYGQDEALSIARAICFETPQSFGLMPCHPGNVSVQ